MSAFFAANRLSNEEREDILKQHRTLYDGYRTMQSQVSNEQPLYVQDFAKDKAGAVLNNKGVAKPYTNFGINEQIESKEVCDECGAMEMDESKEMCSECGGIMTEGECMECGWKGEVGAMEEQPLPTDHMAIEEETGHLDDIYNVEDLGDSDFDYVEGGGNDYGTFEKMHHMKKIKSESDYEDPDNEDDGFEDLQADEEIDEQGYTGGGNAPDMDLSNIDPAYDFISNGPGDVYPTEGEMDEECLDCYEEMESAWSEEEMDEANDISGVQGIYGDMEPAYDFDSKGPGSAGPYQRSSWNEQESEDEDAYWENDLEDGELDLDLSKFNPEDKSWEEIKAYTGDWDEIDEDLQESFMIQKNKVMEMMNRMKIIK